MSVSQDRPNTFSIVVGERGAAGRQVRASFFGALPFGRVSDPEATDDGVMMVASLDDLMAHKSKVIRQRQQADDYRDLATMIDAGMSVGRGVATARQMFGPQFEPIECLKAMVCFEGGDLSTLARDYRQKLIGAIMSTTELPDVSIKSAALTDLAPLGANGAEPAHPSTGSGFFDRGKIDGKPL